MRNPDPGPMRWTTARDFCVSRGLQLAVIRNAVDQAAFEELSQDIQAMELSTHDLKSVLERQKQPFTLGPERSFYAHAYTVRIGVYDTKPLSFDLMMTACTMVYLFAILVALVGREEAVKVVGELFKGSKRKQR